MFLLIMFLLAAVLCGAAGWGLEKAEGGVQAGRFLRRALWPLGAICLMLPFLARSFSPGDLLKAAAALPLGAGLLAAVQACFVLRRSRTGKKAGVLAAAALVLGCLFLELVPFQVNYWASRGYQPVPLLSAQNAVQWNDAHPELTVSGLRVKAKNLLICYSESGGGAVSAQVSCRDSAFPNRMLPMDGLWQMSEQNEASRCYNLHLDGELLELSLKISAGQQAQVSSITANVPRPFAFSPVRLLCLVLLAGLGFALVGAPLAERLYRDPAVGDYVRRLSMAAPFMYMESMVDGVLKGLGEQLASFRYSLLDSVLRMAGIALLLPRFGMGAFLGIMVASNAMTCLLNLNHMRKKLKVAP